MKRGREATGAPIGPEQASVYQHVKPHEGWDTERIPQAERIQLARTKDIDRRIRRCMEETGEV